MSDDILRDLIAAGRMGGLATIKKDGRPQLSNVVYAYHREPDVIRISVTADRAKTHNLQRDPRASMLVNADGGWRYAVAEADAELGPVCADPHDESVEALVTLYRALQGEHADWADYRAAMIRERRQPLTLHITHVYGAA
ncbi:PPOX class F420-dependent oxidoreductase [Dermatophilaceae bacterium Sec6.4]